MFNLEQLQQRLERNSDIVYRKINCQGELITIVGVESLVDGNRVSEHIIAPLLNHKEVITSVDKLCDEVIIASPVEKVKDLNEAFEHLFGGCVLIFFSSFPDVLRCNVAGYAKRAIDTPTTEATVKGPRDGLSENIQDNLSLIRRRVKCHEVKGEKFVLGNKSRTTCYMLYLEGAVEDKVVQYVRSKIKKIATSKDYIFYSNDIEENLKAKHTAFDTVGYTEKADVLAQKISEGRIVLLVDGSANGAIVPCFFTDFFQSSDDYTLNKYMANTARFLRFLSFWVSVLVPGLFLALVTHHFRLIPSILLFKMAMFRSVVPVPTIVELIIMIGFFQILREAGVRLPQPIGSTLSIVGALILGEAAVQSGLASQITVVVIGITSICSYLVPKLYIAIFYWNTLIVLFSAALGLPGFYIAFVMLISHLASLDTVGYPYLHPIATRAKYKYQDITYRGTLNEIGKPVVPGKGTGDK